MSKDSYSPDVSVFTKSEADEESPDTLDSRTVQPRRFRIDTLWWLALKSSVSRWR